MRTDDVVAPTRRRLEAAMSRQVLVRSAAAGAALVALVAVPALPAAATPGAPETVCTVTWIGGATGDWRAPTNWSPARVPTRADVVCGGAGTPVISVTNLSSGAEPVQVRSLRIGRATLAIDDGQQVTVGALDLSGGVVRGPGALVAQKLTIGTGTTAGLAAAVRVDAVRTTVSGTLRMSGESTLVLESSASLTDGAEISAGDASPGLVFNYGVLTTSGDVSIGPDFTQWDFDRLGAVVVPLGSTLTLLHVADLSASGGNSLRGSYDVEGKVVFPTSVRGIRECDVHVAASGLVLDAAGRPALRNLAFVTDHARVVLDQDLAGNRPLYLQTGPTMTVNGQVSFPSVFVAGASLFVVNGTLATTDGRAPGVTVSGDKGPPSAEGLVLGRGARLRASVRLDVHGSLQLATDADPPPTVQGGLTSDRQATTVIAWGETADPQPGVRFSGPVQLAGTLQVELPGTPLPVGSSIRVLVAGGVSGKYRDVEVTGPNGRTVQVLYSATQVVARITG